MQDLFSELLWDNDQLPEAAARLCESLPGFEQVQRDYEEAARQIQELVGFHRFDQFQQLILRYTGYEVRAYYALGLGLRESLVRALEL